jgi:Replicative DNA helicase
MAEIARLHPAEEKSFRVAPHNVEVEQALLGAILINNDAFYRVADFLLPEHFYEPIHREIYELAGKIIRAGKAAEPATLKTHLPEQLLPDVTMMQYLSRLAAEATTVLNAGDYGQAIYDLAIRRSLIQVGEEMVSVAYSSDVEMTPVKQIEKVEGELFQLAEKGRYDGGFQNFSTALNASIQMAGEAFQRDGGLSGIATDLHDLDRQMGGLQRSDLIILAGRRPWARPRW